MKLKQYLKTIVKKYQQICNVISIFYNITMLNHKKIKGRNNSINNSCAFFKKCSIKIIGNNNRIIVGKQCTLKKANITIFGDNHLLKIDDNCSLKNSNFILEDNNCKILIGSKTTAEGVHFAAVEPNSIIKVGEDSMFSNNIEILTTDSHSIIDFSTEQRINYAKNVTIGKHVWVCSNARILKGSDIGDNSIIALGSIVTKSFVNNSIIAGNPAKIVRNNVSWIRERVYK